jgi:hypothetical protein
MYKHLPFHFCHLRNVKEGEQAHPGRDEYETRVVIVACFSNVDNVADSLTVHLQAWFRENWAMTVAHYCNEHAEGCPCKRGIRGMFMRVRVFFFRT